MCPLLPSICPLNTDIDFSQLRKSVGLVSHLVLGLPQGTPVCLLSVPPCPLALSVETLCQYLASAHEQCGRSRLLQLFPFLLLLHCVLHTNCSIYFIIFYFKNKFFSLYIPTPIRSYSLPSSCYPFLPPTPPFIHSSERVRLPMGSQRSLTHHFEAGPRASPLYLG